MIRMGGVPHNTVLRLVEVDRKELSKIMQFPSTKRELLDILHVRVVVFEERVEVKVLFPIPPISNHKCRFPC